MKKLFLSFIALFMMNSNDFSALAQSSITSPSGSYVSSATVTLPGATIASNPISIPQPDVIEPWWVVLLTTVINIIVGLVVRKKEKSLIKRRLYRRIDLLAETEDLSNEQIEVLKSIANRELDGKYES